MPVPAKPRQLLELLLRASGEVVLKESIAAALWRDEPPSDASIARAVSGLRKVLNIGGSDIVRSRYGEGVQLACEIVVDIDDETGDHDIINSFHRTAWEVASSRTPDSLERAIETLRYAVARFPTSASTWALKANAYISLTVRSALAPAEAAAKINRCCTMALRADPNCAGALAASGWALGLLNGHGDEGLKRLDRATHDGSDWPPVVFRAWLNIQRHDLEAAIHDLEKGLAFSPLDRSLTALHAHVKFYQGKFAEADGLARKVLRVRDDIDGLWLVRSIVACENGDFGQACAHAERAATLVQRDRRTLMYLAYAYAKAGQNDRARNLLRDIGPGVNGHTPALLAAPYVALGEIDEAIRIVKVAEAELCPYRAMIWCDPRLKELRSRI